MTTDEVREKYLKFFEARGHKIIPPAPLVLENDPTTLFTSSGMQPLVPYLLGEPHPEGKRVVDVQPCIRVQDIEEVGDNRHDTYFEMLGNWSLGDYFKKEQLSWVWEFMTKEMGLPKDKLYVTIFEGNVAVPKDQESYDIWTSLGVPDSHIVEYGVKKNWWSRAGTPDEMPTGEPGGPTSEIFYEFDHVEHDQSFGERCHPNCDCGRFVEIGNSVFMVYEKTKTGLKELKNKNVDFGGGLERIVMATENEPDMFRTSIFTGVIAKIESMVGKKYDQDERETRHMRIVAEHVRAAAALIENNVEPANKQQGYILRRLIRRAAISMRGLKDNLEKTDLSFSSNSHVNEEIEKELEKFLRTLDKGLREFEKLEKVDGEIAFNLYQTYGFPLEITLELAQEKGQKVNVEEFKKAFEEHQDKSRSASAGVFKGGLVDHSADVTRLHTAHHLVLAALQQVVDKNISQKGSNINAERMRMDFNFSRKLTEDEIKSVENLVNEQVDKNLKVSKKIMPREEAEKIGAQMEFAKKYPDQVSVYFIGPENSPFSLEFCGGPHVSALTELGGHVRIIKEESASSGVRRVYAVIES